MKLPHLPRSRTLLLLLTFALLLIIVAPAYGYVRAPDTVGGDGRAIFRIWGDGDLPIRFVINDQTSAALPNVEAGSDPLGTLRASFLPWQETPTSSIAFVDEGLTPLANAGFDRINLISMVDEANFVPLGVLGLTLSFTSPNGGNIGGADGLVVRDTFPGQILDSDIIFNRNEMFSTNDNEDLNDLGSVAVHEVGHLLGLDHITILTASMRPFTTTGNITGRTIDFDDAFAVTSIYPGVGAANTAARRGAISGRVSTPGGVAVFAANVVAVDASGRSLTATLTLPDGSFMLHELFPGNYTVFAEPLDGPIERNDFLNFISEFQTSGATPSANFPTVFLGGADAPTPVTVSAQQTQTVNLAVNDGQPPALNITNLGRITREGGSIRIRSSRGEVLTPGEEATIVVLGPGITTSTVITVSDPSITVTSAASDASRFGSFLAQFGGGTGVNLIIPADAQPGGRNLMASNGSETAVSVNGLEITGPLEFDNAGGDTPPPPPADPGVLMGTVTNAVDGAPVAGATITTIPPTQSVTTDSAGSYSLTGVPAGAYSVSATASGFTAGSTSATVTAGQTTMADIALTPTATTPPSGAQPISIPSTITGTLQPGDEMLSDGSLADRFEFSGTAGQEIVIELSSSQFDTFLILGFPSGDRAEDDDSGGGANSRLELALPETGTYLLFANALIPGDSGAYTLSISSSTPPPPSGPPSIMLALNHTTFSPGANLQLSAETIAGSPATGDLYVAVLLPDGVTLLFLGDVIGTEALPFRRSTTISSGTEEIFAFQFTGAEPPGAYQFFAAYTDVGANPLTDGVVSNIASTPFQVQ